VKTYLAVGAPVLIRDFAVRDTILVVLLWMQSTLKRDMFYKEIYDKPKVCTCAFFSQCKGRSGARIGSFRDELRLLASLNVSSCGTFDAGGLIEFGE